MLNLVALDIWLFSSHTSGQTNPCFSNPYASNCTSLIMARHNLTFNEFLRVRSQIKLIADAGRLRVSHDNPYSAFEMAMGCYAIGQRLPADDCSSSLHCTQQQTEEVCVLFCPPLPPPPPISIATPSSVSSWIDVTLTSTGKSIIESTEQTFFYERPIVVVILAIVLVFILIVITVVAILWAIPCTRSRIRNIWTRIILNICL